MSFALSAAPRHALRAIACALGIAVLLAQGGCATVAPGAAGARPETGAPAPIPANVEPPPPAVNLLGFPLPYRQGYADGCASAVGRERKDAARFAADGNYRTGWTDGRAVCTKK